MCTVILQVEGDGRLWAAANRDEVLVRPATPPHRWPGEHFVAPRDEVGGGTWLGLTATGLFVAVTNRFGAPKDERRASRGQLVLEALRHRTAAEVHAALTGLPPERFNAFHLVYSDGVDAFVTWNDAEAVHQQTLGPGLHFVTERSFGARPLPGWPAMPERSGDVPGAEPRRVQYLRAHLPAHPSPAQLQALLGTHRPDFPLDSPCVHLPDFGYGTRSSLVLFKARAVADSDWRWADGPPDRTAYVAQRFGALLQP